MRKKVYLQQPVPTGQASLHLDGVSSSLDSKDDVSAEQCDAKNVMATKNEKVTIESSNHMVYQVHEVPTIPMWIVYGLQQAVICVTGGLALPFLICNTICAKDLPEVRAQLLSITFFMGGVSSFLQTTIGIRTPIIQGGSFIYLAPIISMMQLQEWKCPDDPGVLEDGAEPWKRRVLEIQGNLLLASFVHMAVGMTGLVGVLLRFIGPITIGPTIALIGMGLSTSSVNDFAEAHWGAAAFTAGMMLVFSLWLGRLDVIVPTYSKDRGCHAGRFPVFVVVSLLLGVGCGWLFCFILTVSDALPSNSTELAYRARTDTNLDVVSTVPWFQFPYPFQFGLPTFSVAGFFGMLLAAIFSVVESMGDYFAAARVSGAPPPPHHALNRGIAIEGFSSILSSMVGACHATTSYSTNIASIAVTRVASRRVFQTAGVILILVGLTSKIGAVVTLIPDPVIGGLNAVLLGTLIALGLAALKHVDMDSPRNVTVVGLAIMLGLAIPQWVNADPNRIDTGDELANQFLLVLLGTPMLTGAFVAVILDNIAPGTLEERGMIQWQQTRMPDEDPKGSQDDLRKLVSLTYDLPWVSDWLRRVRCCTYVPFLPSFGGFCTSRKSKGNKSETTSTPAIGHESSVNNSAFDNNFE